MTDTQPENAAQKQLREIREEEKRAEREFADRKRAVYEASLKAAETDKAADDKTVQMLLDMQGENSFPSLEFPVEIHGIDCTGSPMSKGWRAQGAPVAVRKCSDGKTYLGLYLGDLATGVCCYLNEQTGIVHFSLGRHNPAIWIPQTCEMVYGLESWWSPIEKPEDLEQITDEDIQNTWYVKALKERLCASSAEESE